MSRRSEGLKLFTTSLVAFATSLPASSARAAEGKAGAVEKQRQGEVEKAPSGTGLETIAPVGSEDKRVRYTGRAWEVAVELEGHHRVRQNDVDQATANYEYLAATLRWRPSDLDLLTFRAAAYRYGIRDPDETGFRADDLQLNYYRLVPLPEDFNLRLGARLTAPTNIVSRRRSLITEPSVYARVTKSVGPVALGVYSRFRYEWMKYTTAAATDWSDGTPSGGSVNPKFRWTFGADAEAALPLWPALSFGAEGYSSYYWYYEPGNDGPTGRPVSAVQDSQFSGEPVTQTYGGDVFIRYTFPEFEQIQSDLRVAYGNEDASLHDGVSHWYPFFRRAAEVYAVFTAVY